MADQAELASCVLRGNDGARVEYTMSNRYSETPHSACQVAPYAGSPRRPDPYRITAPSPHPRSLGRESCEPQPPRSFGHDRQKRKAPAHMKTARSISVWAALRSPRPHRPSADSSTFTSAVRPKWCTRPQRWAEGCEGGGSAGSWNGMS
jgi:hypothetical protein